MPSIYEGFGLPILEAMSCGCPVLCGNKGSLTEVANDAAIYFNPNDVESMKDSMEKYVDTPELKEKFKIAGYKNIEKFTWESCAKSTIEIYKK
jgi:glycosyltransferase involved in cell wall biosynthesis